MTRLDGLDLLVTTVDEVCVLSPGQTKFFEWSKGKEKARGLGKYSSLFAM